MTIMCVCVCCYSTRNRMMVIFLRTRREGRFAGDQPDRCVATRPAATPSAATATRENRRRRRRQQRSDAAKVVRVIRGGRRRPGDHGRQDRDGRRRGDYLRGRSTRHTCRRSRSRRRRWSRKRNGHCVLVAQTRRRARRAGARPRRVFLRARLRVGTHRHAGGRHVRTGLQAHQQVAAEIQVQRIAAVSILRFISQCNNKLVTSLTVISGSIRFCALKNS